MAKYRQPKRVCDQIIRCSFKLFRFYPHVAMRMRTTLVESHSRLTHTHTSLHKETNDFVCHHLILKFPAMKRCGETLLNSKQNRHDVLLRRVIWCGLVGEFIVWLFIGNFSFKLDCFCDKKTRAPRWDVIHKICMTYGRHKCTCRSTLEEEWKRQRVFLWVRMVCLPVKQIVEVRHQMSKMALNSKHFRPNLWLILTFRVVVHGTITIESIVWSSYSNDIHQRKGIKTQAVAFKWDRKNERKRSKKNKLLISFRFFLFISCARPSTIHVNIICFQYKNSSNRK